MNHEGHIADQNTFDLEWNRMKTAWIHSAEKECGRSKGWGGIRDLMVEFGSGKR